MKSKKLKTLAVAVVLSLTVGAVPPVTGTEIPMITTTVEAAAKKVSLKAYNKKVYAGRSGKIKVKSTRGAKLSYKTSNKKIATVNSKGVITGKSAGTAKTTRIQAIAELQKRKTEIQNRLQNGQSQDSTTIGGNSFTEDEWKKIIQKMDEYLTEVKQEQKERFEKRDKEKEIQQFYEKMKMAEQYKKPQAEKLTIQKHLDGEDIAPYSYLAEDGVITYNGVSFFCDYENNAITLGDMSDEKNVITVQLENGGCLKVNRDNIEDLSKAIAMFSPEDIRRILVALQQDAKVRQMQQEIEQDKIKQLLAER